VVGGTGGFPTGSGGGSGGFAQGTGGSTSASGGAPGSGGVPGSGGGPGSGGAPGCSASTCPGVCDSGGVCRSKLGQQCTAAPGGCVTGATCLDGICCGSAACGACLNCGTSGTCNAVVTNADDTTSVSCTGINTCDSSGKCNARPCSSTGCGIQGACIAGTCQNARRVFVSNTKLAGNFASPSGLAGNVADSKCQSFADAANLGGTWKAWLSDSTTSPSLRFERATVPYTLIDGIVIASNWTSLTSGALLHGVDKSETGTSESNAGVWTATDYTGAPLISGQSGTTFPIGDCSDFTSNTSGPPYPAIGLGGATDITWSYVYLVGCDQLEHLYCFEQNQ
jgi:hypothetical protein